MNIIITTTKNSYSLHTDTIAILGFYYYFITNRMVEGAMNRNW